MKTIYEITNNKSFRQLSHEQREELFARQSQLVTMWQDEQDFLTKEEIFDELFDSMKGLIKSMSYRRAERSFTDEQEDFEAIMNLVLIETLVSFDRTLNKPFQPVYILNVKYAMGLMYREKGYDAHETTHSYSLRLDNEVPNTDESLTILDSLEIKEQTDFASEIEIEMSTEVITEELFGSDDVKRTVVHMFKQGFKRSEIVSAVNTNGKSNDAVAKMVNRTTKEFKEACSKLMYGTHI